MFLVDTNVLLDIFTDDATWRSWSERAIRDALVAGSVGINPIVYAETSLAFADPAARDRHLDALMVSRLPLPYGAAFLAGRAFLRYRRGGGARAAPLPDFYIGPRRNGRADPHDQGRRPLSHLLPLGEAGDARGSVLTGSPRSADCGRAALSTTRTGPPWVLTGPPRSADDRGPRRSASRA